MDTFLLATKMRIPPGSQNTVRRQRLINVLGNYVAQHKLTLVLAPAGYGKTTLAAQWGQLGQLQIAWLTINKEDNHLERFLRYLLAAWAEVQPDLMESQLGLLLGGIMPDKEAVLSAFIHVANELSEPVAFVLDDYHLISEPSIYEALAFLIDHLPPNIHFVLVGRAEPPLPLARYRARREMAELRVDDLQFQLEETTDFLLRVMGLELAQDGVASLHEQLEGWVAGLQLAALTVQRRLAGTDKLVVSGSHRFIVDYLSEDVLAPLPETVQEFMLQTSILDRLSASICNAVTGGKDGQHILEQLERESLFLLPLDDRREWFRYHPLFAEFLQHQLQRRGSVPNPEYHRRAGRWYFDHDLPERAFHHALTGDDAELVVQIIDRYLNYKLNGGEFRLVREWVDSLPTSWFSEYPVLGLARAGVLAYSGEIKACFHSIREVEQYLIAAENEETHWQQTRVVAIRCLMACLQNDLPRAEEYANQVLPELTLEDVGWWPGIYGALGDTYRQNGHWEQAEKCYLQALSVDHTPQTRFMSANVFGALADLALGQGYLREADDYWRQALAVIQEPESWGRVPLPLSGWIFIRTGELLYEWNELIAAREYVLRGLERAELGGDVRAMLAGYLIVGRLNLTEGDVEATAQYLERARSLVEQAQFLHWISRFERLQLELWMAQDRLRTAVEWSDRMLQDAGIANRPENEVVQLAMARVLIVKGGVPSIERALTLLDQLLLTAKNEGRTGVTIEAVALRSLASWRRGESAGALKSLEHALRLAEPEGYVRLFVDLGLPMARLLQEASSRDVMPEYVETLLAVFGADLLSSSLMEIGLPEPLTNREQEILKLVAAGLTNREIAVELVISPETVKKHTGNIYGKLGVGNRTEATTRARELDLFD